MVSGTATGAEGVEADFVRRSQLIGRTRESLIEAAEALLQNPIEQEDFTLNSRILWEAQGEPGADGCGDAGLTPGLMGTKPLCLSYLDREQAVFYFDGLDGACFEKGAFIVHPVSCYFVNGQGMTGE